MLSIITLLSSCEVEDTPIKEPELIMPSFKSFAFLKDNNRSLEADVYCPINGCDTITLFVPYAKTDSLVATSSVASKTATRASVRRPTAHTITP